MEKVYRDGPIGAGRYREFWQCDIDVVGSKSMKAEAELLSIVEDFDTIEDETIIEGTEDTITIISNHVANLATDLDKSTLDRMLRDLYLEAMSIE